MVVQPMLVKKMDKQYINCLLWFPDFNRLKLQQRRWGNSAHTNNSEGIVTAKNETLMAKDSTTRVATQIKTVTSLFVELVKSTTPSFQVSLANLTKRIPSFPSFQTSDKNKDKIGHVDKSEQQLGSESKTGIPSYFDILARNKDKLPEAAIPRWKVQRKTVSQDSIDARTKHVVSAVAKSVSQSSLLVRLDDFCNHLFQYPQAKSLASRVRFSFKISNQNFYFISIIWSVLGRGGFYSLAPKT